jgi:Domain of unknown function (DUF4442)
MNANFDVFTSKIKNPVLYRLFLLKSLPMAFFSGLKIVAIERNSAIILVQYSWINKNPFGSIYFAVLGMAAELSTGILAFAQTYKLPQKISMLVVANTAQYYKKATGKIIFTCTNGNEIQQCIENCIATNTPSTIICKSIGSNEKNEIVAEFTFTWSFKVKG